MAKTNKKGAGSAVAKIVLGLVLAAICAFAGAFVTGWTITGSPNPAHWVRQDEAGKQETSLMAVTSEGRKLLAGNSYAMPQAMTFVNKSTSYSKERQFSVTATLSNKYINGKFDWAVAFDNPASAWATGKVATYYVDVAPTSDGSATATVKYIAAFNEPIKVTATLRGTEQSDSCTIDCLQTVDLTLISNCPDDLLGDGCDMSFDLKFGIGTTKGEFICKEASIGLTADFIEDLKSYLTFDINVKYIDFENVNGTLRGNQYYCNLADYYTYSMFIEDFDSYDDDHKDAIYWAWYQAYKDGRANGYQSNLELSGKLDYVCCGVVVNTLSTSGYSEGHLNGFDMGSEAAPNVILNQNFVF